MAKQKVTFCQIPSCRDKCDNLTYASPGLLAYYGLKDEPEPTKVKLCPKCREKGEKFEKKAVQAVRDGESIFNYEHEPQNSVPQTVHLGDDGDSEIGNADIPSASRSELVEVDFDRGDVSSIVKGILSKFKIKDQMEKCTEKVMDQASALGEELTGLDNTINSVDNMLVATCQRYNRIFDNRPKPIIVQELEINCDGSMRQRNMVSDEVFVNRESMKKLPDLINKCGETSAASMLDGKDVSSAGTSPSSSAQGTPSISSTAALDVRKPGPASKTGYYEALDAQRSGPFDKKIKRPLPLRKKIVTNLLPTPSIIPRIQPKACDIIYAMYKNLLYFWVKAEVLEVVWNEMTHQTEFVVHFEPMKNGRPTGGVEGDGIERLVRQLCSKQMAVNVPCPFILPVGSRIIAKFKGALTTDPETDGQYYAGIVAEPPKEISQMRYLVFFDDGFAQYVDPDDVLLVCQSDRLVWNDVYPDTYDFVKEYVTKYPDWPMVKVHAGSIVATEWNGRWMPARILKVDNSLAYVRFENDGREEWIYRGSTRLRPINRVIVRPDPMRRRKEQEEGSSKENKIPRHDPNHFKKSSSEVGIEYKWEDGVTAEMLRTRVAKKSTARAHFHQDLEMFTRSSKLFSSPSDMLDPDLCIEYQGSLTPIKVPEHAPKPKDFEPHDCDSSCVIKFAPSEELSRTSPLAIPFFFGWTREVCTKPSHTVFYRAPCGQRLRDIEEVAQYLDKTDANLSVDYFCLDYDVDCMHEFVPARAFVDIKDISYGKEGAPVKCINSIDYEPLPFMDYIPGRVMAQGVTINTDPDFLVCCDCTDNCEDTEKCACWQLTTQGIAFTKLSEENNPTEGYQFRRLKDHLVSGIYECNSRCKCRQTCSNRVVQNGVQWPLQIFKTSTKGWGIRTMYDMPEGTFICIYSGQVMTDGMANEEGVDKGDEYLAELDYIECNEGVKENYESDVTDIEADGREDDDSEEDMSQLLERKQVRKRNKVAFSQEEKEKGGHDADCEDSETEEKDEPKKVTTSESSAKPVGEPRQKRLATRRTAGQKKYLGNGEAILNNDDDIITARASCLHPKSNSSRKRIPHRDLYGPNEECFIMDAKSKGNIGRYLNHSCRPNVFVQNVFVDTHDARFPLVAFFTNTLVKAGTELTWDYHYKIGSVPGKVLYCFCMTPYCRGRLL